MPPLYKRQFPLASETYRLLLQSVPRRMLGMRSDEEHHRRPEAERQIENAAEMMGHAIWFIFGPTHYLTLWSSANKSKAAPSTLLLTTHRPFGRGIF